MAAPDRTAPNPTAPYAVKRRVTVTAGIANLLLGGGKVVAGYAGQSHALIADGVHSLSDLLSDVMVLVAVRFGGRGPDENHPYGHARIETAATAGVGMLLIAVAAGFVYDAGQRLLAPDALWMPGWLALAAACISVAVKEGLYHYTRRAATTVKSSLLEANAWHHRSDALSSVVVIGGVAGTMLGIVWLDAMAAVFVAIMIAQVGWRLGFRAVEELVDTGVELPDLQQLKARIDAVDGVHSHHGLRTRRMGPDVLADVHIRVDPELTVSEAHRIAEAVSSALLASLEPLTEVLVHVDHEPADDAARSRALPVPAEVRRSLREAWAVRHLDVAPEQVRLHYRRGRVDVDVLLPAASKDASPAIVERLRDASRALRYVGRVQVLHRVDPASGRGEE